MTVAGLVLLTGGLIVLSILDGHSSYWLLLAGLLPLGAGMGLAMTPATAAVTDALPAAKQGIGSAMNDLARELGGALGIAVLGSVLQSTYRNHLQLPRRRPPCRRCLHRRHAVRADHRSGRRRPRGDRRGCPATRDLTRSPRRHRRRNRHPPSPSVATQDVQARDPRVLRRGTRPRTMIATVAHANGLPLTSQPQRLSITRKHRGVNVA